MLKTRLMKAIVKNILATVLLLAITSCNTHKATIKDLKSKKTNYQMSYDAMRRGTIVTIDSEGKVSKMLAEVQPDAAIAQTTDLTNSLTAKLKSGDELTASQITKITESLSTLGQRTAAVNILRDALYRLEEHCINFPAKCEDNYWERYDTVVKQIVELQKQMAKQDSEKTAQAAEETKRVKAEIQLKSLDTEFDARTNYQTAIKFLLDQDEKNSLNYFKELYEKYPIHFNIDEINKKLVELSKNGMKETQWKELYKYIIKEKLTYRIDDKLIDLLKEKSK